MEWKFEKRAVVANPVGEVNVLHCKLLVALEMLRELGYRAEFDRLAEKFVKEAPRKVEEAPRKVEGRVSAYFSSEQKSWVRMERQADGEYCHTSGYATEQEALG